MIVIGLTGSGGMGKPTTAALFAGEGVPVFDTDAAVHALYRGAAAARIDAAFPGVARDGAVDRAELGRRVIGDPAAMRRLERIVHPLVRAERGRFLDAERARGSPFTLLDIPLLFETGVEGEVDAVVVASAPEAVQRARVLARPGMTAERFDAIVGKQMPDAEKRRRARFVIETGDGIAEAVRQVRAVLAALGAEEERCAR